MHSKGRLISSQGYRPRRDRLGTKVRPRAGLGP
jgi:hypothetical protein